MEQVAAGRWEYNPKNKWLPNAHQPEEGLAIGDVDGDIDSDGKQEIVLSEGDPCIYGRVEGGRLAWFKPSNDSTALWEEHVLEEGLLDAHSLQLGDICGNGRLDIFVGEIGMVDPETDTYVNRLPRLIIYENRGAAGFTRHIIDEGTGTHNAVFSRLKGQRRLRHCWKAFTWFGEMTGTRLA